MMPTGDGSASHGSSTPDLLSKVSRYEALFELTGIMNPADDVQSVGEILARRLKYIADIISWRYICFDGSFRDPDSPKLPAIVVDGYRGRADLHHTIVRALSPVERALRRDRKTRILSGQEMRDAQESLPKHLQRSDIEQISIHVIVEEGRSRALHLYCRRRQGLSELDLKCLSMVSTFFHEKVKTLWERQKLRELELAYLEQEAMLRHSEQLATLGRLSGGLAHELNNPAAAALAGVQQLRSALTRLRETQYSLGEIGLTDAQRSLIRRLQGTAEAGTRIHADLDPLQRDEREQEVEGWLERNSVADGWKHAPDLVEMGFDRDDLHELARTFRASDLGTVIGGLTSAFEASEILAGIGAGTRRVSEMVEAMKGYSYLDQAPVQQVDVREGLDNTLRVLGSRLRGGIRVELDYEADLPRIQAYGSELNQVWTNLIENAIDATEGEGMLYLRAYQDQEWVVVDVADDGPGIPDSDQGKVFDPFYTTKPPGEGKGLGLSVSHAIVVQKHGGEISVESQPGSTCFQVRLPRTIPADRPIDDNDMPIHLNRGEAP